MTEWPFADPKNVAVITTRYILEGSRFVQTVTHYEDDGCWVFHCGTTNETEDGRIVALSNMVARDPSIVELADLPFGWCAWRESPDHPWVRERQSGEPD